MLNPVPLMLRVEKEQLSADWVALPERFLRQ